MAERNRDHIRVTGRGRSLDYERPGGGGGAPPPFSGDPSQHGNSLRRQYSDAVEQQSEPVEDLGGFRVTFRSFPDIVLVLNSLEVHGAGEQPELLAVNEVATDAGKVTEATVFIPEGRIEYFLSKINKYVDSAENGDGKPANATIIECIESIRRATVKELWTDPPAEFPGDDESIWWEVWLRGRGTRGLSRLREMARALELRMGEHSLGFEGRTVAVLKATPNQLIQVLQKLDDVAELRNLHEVSTVVPASEPAEQQEWVRDLLERLIPPPSGAPAVCVLDCGVKRTHPLLQNALPKESMFVANPKWNPEPYGCGHGTEMAGIALYGDLQKTLLGQSLCRLNHGLESVKVLPDSGENPPELFGAVTANAVDQPEIQDAARSRVFMMAITSIAAPAMAAGDTEHAALSGAGRPTSWSAVVDALSFGRSVQTSSNGLVYIDRSEELEPRLFVLSAGNIRDLRASDDFLDRCDAEAIEDPAQAWNAITVGAYADRDSMRGAPSGSDGYEPIALRGELSPASRTSVSFDGKKWPVKPDVVAPGGNWAKSPYGSAVDAPENLAILTTRNFGLGQGEFTTTRDTSAATAHVACIASEVMVKYPDLWPTSVRALVVHSAEWTEQMLRRFNDKRGRTKVSKREAVNLARRYGMGVPSLDRAIHSADNALTMVEESTLEPYRHAEGRRDKRLGDMNLHDLPWPKEELRGLSDVTVRMRVTLSYFVEPNPSRRGWAGRYAYPSFGLRFATKNPVESVSEFLMRVNKKNRDDKYMKGNPEKGWLLGANQQKAPGSIHTDIWTGTAADLAAKGQIAVYPVGGWWKSRPELDQSDNGVRYSLVVSIEAPEIDVDLWTPVAQQVGLVVET